MTPSLKASFSAGPGTSRRTRSSRNSARCSIPTPGVCYESETETDIEHMVALEEAHHSGMCFADRETKRTFAGDLLNLTVAAPEVNREKSSQDAGDWMPDNEQVLVLAERVLDVKLKYGMTVDREEASALELVLAGCESTEIVNPACADGS